LFIWQQSMKSVLIRKNGGCIFPLSSRNTAHCAMFSYQIRVQKAANRV
jgi:hypothetical protein